MNLTNFKTLSNKEHEYDKQNKGGGYKIKKRPRNATALVAQ